MVSGHSRDRVITSVLGDRGRAELRDGLNGWMVGTPSVQYSEDKNFTEVEE